MLLDIFALLRRSDASFSYRVLLFGLAMLAFADLFKSREKPAHFVRLAEL